MEQRDYSHLDRYTQDHINSRDFADESTYGLLREILLHHPDSIVRHEAAFVMGELCLVDEIPFLVSVFKRDTSIVAKHEAIEAIGFICRGFASAGFDTAQLRRYLKYLERVHEVPSPFDDECSHPDVVRTVEIACQRMRELLSS